MIGYVDDYELSKWYNGAKALLYPSLYEGFGLPILEAFAHRVPVITCRNSSLAEVGGDAVIYSETDCNSIKSAMDKVCCDQIFVDSLIKDGNKQFLKFTWEKFGKELCSGLLSNRVIK